MAITASVALRNALNENYPQINLLVDMSVSGNIYRLTDASVTVTRSGASYSPSTALFGEVNLPEQRDEVARDQMSLTLIDDDSQTWHKRLQDIESVVVHLWIMFNAGTQNPTEALSIFFGYGIGLSRRVDDSRPNHLLLTFTGPIRQTDGEHTVVTSDSNQRLRDPNDTAFANVGILREFSWGKR